VFFFTTVLQKYQEIMVPLHEYYIEEGMCVCKNVVLQEVHYKESASKKGRSEI
jgi:hypothetical protein